MDNIIKLTFEMYPCNNELVFKLDGEKIELDKGLSLYKHYVALACKRHIQDAIKTKLKSPITKKQVINLIDNLYTNE